jgi:iron-sulfur cluster repair protein YtfE (RIC family)
MPTHEKSASGKGTPHGKSAEMNIFEVLKEDHEKARNLFQKLEKSGRKEVAVLQKLFAQLQEELEVHMEGEERFLYSALEKYEEPREQVLESYEEHQVAKTLMGTFKNLAVDDERWGAKVSVLQEILEHHMQEEEGELFKVARKVLSKGQIEEISLMFQQHKKEGRRPSRGAPVEG